ncbi:kinase-like domain-containing protein [Xylaria bambusicola]|uniref:kinase-like domain-containing protein n=1 Tax=Xylaria bambusicola TaxID=326684 RepID=UPI00200794CF|nr:kinase-like domain-containing protein [Xylaria bambusicola]KAI0505226.1 kinase-like domain-containing protein [Xylaria bambusicola]
MATSTREQVRLLCRSFKEWVQRNVQQGIDGNDEEMDYVSYSKLKDYWTHDRIGIILGSYDREVDIDMIQHSFIQVISILTYISDDIHRWTEYLVYFYRTETDDDSLPLPTYDARSRRNPAPFEHFLSDGPQAWWQFSTHQWKFLPLNFKRKDRIIDRVHDPRTLDPRYIIPVTIESELSKRPGGSARVLKVLPHEASGLQPEKGSITLKMYDKDRYHQEFLHERHIYTTIRNMRRTATIDVSKYFLSYYGCYVQGNKCVLVVEYANQGSLLEFFRKNWHLPRTGEEARGLWHRLGQLNNGLALLHNGGQYTSSLHQDIKPANIFVFEDSSTGDLCFKFGDFGTSSVTPIAEIGDTIGDDHGGTKMYSAPELCAIDDEVHMAEKITWGADIWSFGCVLLDFGVWMALHERGRIAFRKERVEETRSLKRSSLSNAGYDGAFHNGEKILTAINHKIEEIWRLDSPVARSVGHVMEFIQREMLRPNDMERLNAQQLKARFQDAIEGLGSPPLHSVRRMPSQISEDSIARTRTSIGQNRDTVILENRSSREEEAERNGEPQRSATCFPQTQVTDDGNLSRVSLTQVSVGRSQSVTLPHRGAPTPSSSSSNQSRPLGSRQDSVGQSGSMVSRNSKLTSASNSTSEHTIKDILEWIPKIKAQQAFMPKWLEKTLEQVRGRDQCFIFDNSVSMTEHWNHVKHAGDALTYVLKNVDPDGFEVHMTNGGDSIKRKDRKGLFEAFGYFDTHCPRADSGSCAMENVLSNILETAVTKALAQPSGFYLRRSGKIKGISVYVFTNGVWEKRRSRCGSPREAGGVENAIKSAVQRLQDAKKMRTFLSIQFISFGNDPEGRRRMDWLDDDIEEITDGWDIVDTTHHTGSVEKMVIGAISGAMDGDKHSKATNREPIGVTET